jgi:hypothetical protein
MPVKQLEQHCSSLCEIIINITTITTTTTTSTTEV